MKSVHLGVANQKRWILAVITSLVCALGSAPAAQAANGTTASPDPTRDFITTCTYGALAGGLVGAATLAFSNDPGNKINNVARGASLGLYVGIALGLYMLNGGPGGSDDDAAAAAAAGITQTESAPSFKSNAATRSSDQIERTQAQDRTQTSAKSKTSPSVGFAILPMVSERGFEGASAQIQFAQF